mgnify:CR=1 FL=1
MNFCKSLVFREGEGRPTENRNVSKFRNANLETRFYRSCINLHHTSSNSMDGMTGLGDGTVATACKLDTTAADLVCMEEMPAWEYELDGTDGVLDVWGLPISEYDSALLAATRVGHQCATWGIVSINCRSHKPPQIPGHALPIIYKLDKTTQLKFLGMLCRALPII